MHSFKSASRWAALLLASGFLLPGLQPSEGVAAAYGRLAGIVFDTQGTPLMGATVMILGPTALAAELASQTMERVITDAQGRFTVEHLVPGWYSLKVSSPTRLPAMRNGIRVAAGETAIARFVLTDSFAPIRFQVPNSSVSTWGDDWKWVLRTSSTTRPILRFREQSQVAKVSSEKDEKLPLPPTQRMIGILPGFARRDPLADDPGLGSVIAYLRPLSPDSDLLVAGSFAPASTEAGTLAAVFRRYNLKGESQEMGLIVHQFSLAGGVPLPPGNGLEGSSGGQGLVLRYADTRLIAPKVLVTAGMDVNYLNSLDEVMSAQPHVKLEYQATGATVLAVQYGSARADGSDTLLERVGMLDAFPRITERDYRLKLEQLNHTEVSANRRIGKSARVQAAAYRDDLRNAAVWGSGNPTGMAGLAGNFLPNPAVQGIVLNAGNYRSAGFRAVYSQTFGKHCEALLSYATGDALVAGGAGGQTRLADLQGALHAQQTTSLMGKFSSEIPVTHTRFVSAYEWVPNGRLSLVDPYGQASSQVQPYLGFQIRQPLPTLTFLPAHIEALADFRNLLGQGYVPVGQAGEKTLLLSSGYRCFRGGFSVQF
jgi:hypothetical protein